MTYFSSYFSHSVFRKFFVYFAFFLVDVAAASGHASVPPSATMLAEKLYHLAFPSSKESVGRAHQRNNSDWAQLLNDVLYSDWTRLGPFWYVLNCFKDTLEPPSRSEDEDWQGDAVVFRNWVVNHMDLGKPCPLAGSIRYVIHQSGVGTCSVSISLAFLAVAHGYNNTKESLEMIKMAEENMKLCAYPSFADFLTRGFDLWTVLLRTLQNLNLAPTAECSSISQPTSHPPSSSSRGLDTPSLGGERPSWLDDGSDASGSYGHQQQQQQQQQQQHPHHEEQQGESWVGECPAVDPKKWNFTPTELSTLHDFGPLLPHFAVDKEYYSAYLDSLARHAGGFINQIVINGMISQRGFVNTPSWDIINDMGRRRLVIRDPNFPTNYSFTLEPVSVALVLNAEKVYVNSMWTRAYEKAFEELGLKAQYVHSAKELVGAPVIFWRINADFENRKHKHTPHLGRSLYNFLSDFGTPNKIWPPLSSVKYYQDKIEQLEAFVKHGIPTPASIVIAREDIGKLHQVPHELFPMLLKHPYSSSSAGLEKCDGLEHVQTCAIGWFNRNPGWEQFILQEFLDIDADMRVTYIGEEIIHGYWRKKKSRSDFSSGTSSGSTLDFNIPRHALLPVVRKLIKMVPIGAADISIIDLNQPMVFEVSPIFEMNPPPPSELADQPYADYKKTNHYEEARQKMYDYAAHKIVTHALHFGDKLQLVIDIDNTICSSYIRLQNSPDPYSDEAVMKDQPLDFAAETLSMLSAHYSLLYLTARASWGFQRALNLTATWLQLHQFPEAPITLVDKPRGKLAFLSERTILIDDLTTGHHKGKASIMEDMIQMLERRKLPFHRFNLWAGDSWQVLGLQLMKRSKQVNVED